MAAADPQTTDDDPYVTLGRQVTSGNAPAPAAANDDDPYVKLGRQVTGQTSGAKRTPVDLTPPATDQAITGIPAIDHFMLGEAQGAKDVAATGANVAKWVNDRVPFLASLDRSVGLDPGAAVNALAGDRAAYDASPAGQGYAGAVGRMVGGGLVTAPVLGPVGNALGGGMRAAGAILPGTGIVGNLVGRGVTRAVQGGGTGALYGGATSSGSDQPVGQNMLANAVGGAIAGPVLGAAGDTAGGLWGGAKNYIGQFTGKTEAAQIENAFADARMRSGPLPPAASPAPVPPPPGGDPVIAARLEASMPAGTRAAAAVNNGTAPPAAEGVPNSVGAAATTPGEGPAMDAKEALASRVAGFEARMSQQPKLGFDNTEYVKGNTSTTAEMYADPVLAQQQRVLAAGSPEMTAIDRNNNVGRLQHFDDIGPGPMELNTLKGTRDTNGKATNATAFDPATMGAADAAPTMTHMQGILDSSEGKLEPVQVALAKVQKALQKRDGSGLETDPQQLYGVGKQINFMMSKLGAADTPGNADDTVLRALQSTKENLYDQIEAAAPGFDKFRSDYQRDSVPINVGEMLQKYRPSLLGGNDGATMSLNPVNSMLKSIGQRLGSDNKLDAAKSLSDDQVDQLFNLRSDLQRQNNRYLAKPAGSNTQHDLNLASEMGLHGAAGMTNSLLGRVPGGDMAANALAGIARNASAKNKAALTRNLLYPPDPMVPPDGGYHH